MLGYSSPGRAVATPPTAECHDVLIHVDLVEDWTPYPPRSPPSAQCGLPSDVSDDDDRPMPRTYPGTWKKGTEDGQKEPRQIRQISQAVDSGCRGMPRGERRRDGDDGDHGGRRSWKDMLLGRGRADKNQGKHQESSSLRRHSRSPPGQRREGSSRGRNLSRRRSIEGRHDAPSALLLQPPCLLQPAPPATTTAPEAAAAAIDDDPIPSFFTGNEHAFQPVGGVDCMAAELEAHAARAVAAPLTFDGPQQLADSPLHGPSDALGPTLVGPPLALCQRQPLPPTTTQLQLGMVTQQVCNLQIAADAEAPPLPPLFQQVQAPIIATAPTAPTAAGRRSSAPPKTRAIPAPTRRSDRQAEVQPDVPVIQRATLRLVRELGLLDPKAKMTPKAAEELIRKFDEPLTDEDIDIIAKLTDLDGEALRVAARIRSLIMWSDIFTTN
ncbi:hypothetical protein VPH35_102059 [Triticum aestivum]